MNGNELLTVMVVIVGVASAVLTYHDRTLSPNVRFGMAMLDVFLAGSWLFYQITDWQWLDDSSSVLLIILVFIGTRSIARTHRRQKIFERVLLITEMMVAMTFCERGKLEISETDQQKIKKFLSEISPKHREQADYFKRNYFQSSTGHDYKEFRQHYTGLDYQNLIDEYWSHYQD